MHVVEFTVRAVDGECLEIPELEIGARFRYPSSATTWAVSRTKADGCAAFRDEHLEQPIEVDLFVDSEHCGSFPIEYNTTIVLEL